VNELEKLSLSELEVLLKVLTAWRDSAKSEQSYVILNRKVWRVARALKIKMANRDG